jgi:glycosyltransferase involved in cell wall biosynthesis
MKILLIYSGKSGPMRIGAELTKFLHRKGCDVYLYLLDSSEYEYDFTGIRTNFPSPFFDRLGYFGKFLRLLKLGEIKFNPDVILTSFAFSIPFIKNFFPKRSIVYNMMGSPRPEVVTDNFPLKVYYIIEKLLSSFYARRVCTFTISEYHQRYILNKWKIPINYIHNGIDIESYRPAAPEDKLRIKKELEVENFDVVVTLGLTRFTPMYKPFYIKWYIEALRRHPEKKILSIILGKINQDQSQKLKRYISENTATNHKFELVYLKNPPKNHPLKYYQISDFFISFLPQSLMEKEALACGLPVVTEFWEGKKAKELLQECQHHLCRAEFIKLVDLFVSDNRKLKVYSKLSRIVAERDFSSEVMAERYLHAFKSIRNQHDAL